MDRIRLIFPLTNYALYDTAAELLPLLFPLN